LFKKRYGARGKESREGKSLRWKKKKKSAEKDSRQNILEKGTKPQRLKNSLMSVLHKKEEGERGRTKRSESIGFITVIEKEREANFNEEVISQENSQDHG